jgi:hypothetical protein
MGMFSFLKPHIIGLIIVVLLVVIYVLRPKVKEGLEAGKRLLVNDMSNQDTKIATDIVRQVRKDNLGTISDFNQIQALGGDGGNGLPVVSDAEVFVRADGEQDKKDLNRVNASEVIVLNDSVRAKEATCDALNSSDKNIMAKLDSMIGTDCGYCVPTAKFNYGNNDGPLTDVCPGPKKNWIKTRDQFDQFYKEYERGICAKVDYCEDMTGEKAICGWSPLEGKAYVKETNPSDPTRVLPKYPEDRNAFMGDSDRMKYGLINGAKCKEFASMNPCVGKNMNTGPHSDECLRSVWKKVGCSPEGSSIRNAGQMNWWKRRGIKAVESDMKLYKKYNDSLDYKVAAYYMPKCSGKDPTPCDPRWKNKPIACYQAAFKEIGGSEKGRLYPSDEKFRNYPKKYEDLKKKVQNGTMSVDEFKKIVSKEKHMLLDEGETYINRNQSFINVFGSKLPEPQVKIQEVQVGSSPGLNLYVYRAADRNGARGELLVKNPQRVPIVKFDTGFLRRKEIDTPQSDFVYLLFEGHVSYPEGAREVQFRTTSDDGSRLYINNKLEVDNWGLHGKRGINGTKRRITQNKEDLRLEFYEWGGAANIELMWAIDGQDYEIIPAKYLSAPAPKKQVTRSTDWQCVTGVGVPVRINPTGDVECASKNNKDCMWGGCDEKRIEEATRHTSTALACGDEHKAKWGGTGYGGNHWCQKSLDAIQRKLNSRGDWGIWLTLVHQKGKHIYSMSESYYGYSTNYRGRGTLVPELSEGPQPPFMEGSFTYNDKIVTFMRARERYIKDAYRRQEAFCACGHYLSDSGYGRHTKYLSSYKTPSSGCSSGRHRINNCGWRRGHPSAGFVIFMGHKNDIVNFLNEKKSLHAVWFLDVKDEFKRHAGSSNYARLKNFMENNSYA